MLTDFNFYKTINMKTIKTALIVLLLTMGFLPAIAGGGDDDDKKFYKGVRFGYQSSNLSESDWDDLSSFYVGVFGVKKIGAGNLLSLYSGLEYYQTGTDKNADNKIVLNYLSIPLNLRLKLGPVYAFGGFNPSFMIADNAKIGGQDVDPDINGFDIGGQIGIGVKFLFLGVELKYNQGLTDVGNDNKTNHLQAGLCVYF
jgi:hypothetical protein